MTEVNAVGWSLVRIVAASDFGFSAPGALLVAAGQRVWVANADGTSLTVLPPG